MNVLRYSVAGFLILLGVIVFSIWLMGMIPDKAAVDTVSAASILPWWLIGTLGAGILLIGGMVVLKKLGVHYKLNQFAVMAMALATFWYLSGGQLPDLPALPEFPNVSWFGIISTITILLTVAVGAYGAFKSGETKYAKNIFYLGVCVLMAGGIAYWVFGADLFYEAAGTGQAKLQGALKDTIEGRSSVTLPANLDSKTLLIGVIGLIMLVYLLKSVKGLFGWLPILLVLGASYYAFTHRYEFDRWWNTSEWSQNTNPEWKLTTVNPCQVGGKWAVDNAQEFDKIKPGLMFTWDIGQKERVKLTSRGLMFMQANHSLDGGAAAYTYIAAHAPWVGLCVDGGSPKALLLPYVPNSNY